MNRRSKRSAAGAAAPSASRVRSDRRAATGTAIVTSSSNRLAEPRRGLGRWSSSRGCIPHAPRGYPVGAMARAGLVGRADDVTALAGLLVGGAALVTLTGPGGAGKTALALAVAEAVAPAMPDGVLLVDLTAVAAADAVLPSIAAAARAREGAGRSLDDALRAALGAGRRLLLVDNCEHVLPAMAAVGALAADCPGLSLLATSREPLGLIGEQEWPVAPLATPRPGAALATIAAAPAVELFVRRAVALAPSFELTAANAEAVAGLCRRL